MRVAIVEDDLPCIQQLQGFLKQIEQERNTRICTTVFQNGQIFVDQYRPSQWDLVLMDIEMPLLDGLSAARRIREADPEVLIVFITQIAQFAIQGYEVAALDYVLKPISYYTFSVKMQRVFHILSAREPGCLTFQSGGDWKKVPLSSIRYVEVFNHTLLYHTLDGDYSSTGSRTISQLETDLSGKGFARCNQSYLVNLQYVDTLEQNTAVLTGDIHLRISRNRRKPFMQALMSYWGG